MGKLASTYRPKKQSIIVGLIVGVLLVGFAAFAILEKIVFSYTVATNVPAQTENLGAVDMYAGELDTASLTSSDSQFSITTYRWKNTTITVADIFLQSPQQLRSALAHDTFGHNVVEEPVDFAERLQSALLINGDFYGLQDDGYVIREGVLYRNTSATSGYRLNSLAVMNDGSFKVFKESEISAEELMAQGVWHVFSFGPALVDDGKVQITAENYSNGYVHEASQRSAVAWVSDLHYKFIICNGRSSSGRGLAMWDWADFIGMLGVKVAYNLDGGDSAFMFAGTNLITDDASGSSTFVAERYVGNKMAVRRLSDVIYIAKAQ